MDQDLPTGFRQTPLGLLPQGWEAVSLGSLILRSFSGGTPSTKRPDYWNGSIPWITSAYIDGLYVLQGVKGITQAGLDHSASKLVSRDNLLVGTRVGVGKVAINKIDIAISQDLTGLVIDKEQAHLEFLAYALSSSAAQRAFVSATRGTTIKGIPRDDLLKILVPLPPLPEQRAIASVLRTVQRAIAAAEQVIAAARELKRSLMQHLFTYGPVAVGETGQVTLRETEIGVVPEGWKPARVGDVFEIKLGKMLSQASKKGVSPRPYLRNANVQWGYVDLREVYEMDFTDRERSLFRLRKDDLLVCEGGEIGRTAIWEDQLPVCYYQKAVHRLRPKQIDVLPRFFLYYMMFVFLIRHVPVVEGARSTIAHLPMEKLAMLPVVLPPLAEQCEIVRLLAAADQKIAAEEARKASLEGLFKTLLHHLMTGRVRVPSVPMKEERA